MYQHELLNMGIRFLLFFIYRFLLLNMIQVNVQEKRKMD